MDESSVEDAPIEGNIQILVESIENITVKEETEISFLVVHNDIVLGESAPVAVEPNFEESSRTYNVNFAVELSFIINDRSSMDPVVSIPVLITTMRTVRSQRPLNSVGSTRTRGGSEAESKKKGANSTEKQISLNVIGFCSVDLMPILLGEKSFTARLIMETACISNGADAVSWQNLPVLTATVTNDGGEIFPPGAKINFLSITVESIYNPPGSFAEDAEYKAGTIAYIDDDELPENIIFEDGKWTKYRDAERVKRWQSLSKLQSRARSSKYKLSCDYTDTRNTLTVKPDLEKKAWQDEPRIEWNFMSRCMMHNVGIQAMREHITKHKYWPFQFTVVEKHAEKNIKLKEPTRCQLYQCYIDLSELLFPGRKSTRVVTQLYTYNPLDMADRTGLERDILSINSIDLKEQERKQVSKKQDDTSLQSDTEVIPDVPLTSEIGEPVFVIIEIELHYPLVLSKLETEFSCIMSEMIPPKVTKLPYVYSGEMAEEQYATCIRKLVEIMTENYRDFREEKTRRTLSASRRQENDSNNFEETKDANYCFVSEEDELTCFTQYLHKAGVYLAIRSALKAKVITLLDQKFKIDVSTVDCVNSQNFIASVYTYLVERMHVAINKIVESRLVDDSPPIAIPEKLYLYAEEAYELGHVDDAKRHYQAAVAVNENDPVAWTNYAVFHLKLGDVERAKECCHEAILSDRRNKIALLIYGLILTEERNYREAELFLRSVADLYPRFVEGWVVLHLFYIRTDYCPGIDLTLRVAERCMKDEDRETEVLGDEPIAWATIHCPRDSVYMMTATLLMKLHLCDFVGLALAEEMSRTGRSIHVLYYLAVQHYVSRRYADALSYLKEIECTYGMDYSIGSLFGHCHFQERNFDEAIRCYELASTVFNRPDDLHLVLTRMGLYYEDAGDYERALKVFLGASRVSPTAETWLGAGIALYELQRFTEAEAALSEANRIDNRNATVWKYLCLLNLSLQRSDEFEQCFRQLAQGDGDFSLEKRSLKPRETVQKTIGTGHAPDTGKIRRV